MHSTFRRGTGARGGRGLPSSMPDGLGGTISGGPMAPFDLVERLGRGAPAPGMAGAVAGAGRVEMEQVDEIVLSDGSQIVFATIDKSRLRTKV